MNNALDSIGDDAEIDLGMGGSDHKDGADKSSKPQDAKPEDKGKPADAPEQKKHSKEAGTTSKERFNYASFDCAATVLKTNAECKGPSSVLVENKDTYLLNTCSAKNKFLIVELCNDILIDTIVLGNFEFFSSTFRSFRVSISDRYPVKIDKWRELGTFEAQNTRAVQAFLIENGLIWARYLRIEFLSHYGSEYYCPVSLLRVHGKTMMDDYLNEVKASRGEDDGDDEEEATFQTDQTAAQSPPKPSTSSDTTDPTASSSVNETTASTDGAIVNDTCTISSRSSALVESTGVLQPVCPVGFGNQSHVPQEQEDSSKTVSPEIQARATSSCSTELSSTKKTTITTAPAIEAEPSSPTKPLVSSSTLPPLQSAEKADLPPPSSTKSATSTSTSTPSTPTKPTTDSQRAHGPSPSTNATAPTPPRAATPAIPSPTTQDSFFKSVHKRLLQLESNATLSMQYIEEQSRLLRDALARAERRQRARTGALLDRWNRSVRAELQDALALQSAQARRDAAALRDALRQERADFAAHAAVELRVFRYLVGLQAALLVALGVGFAWFARRAAVGAPPAAARANRPAKVLLCRGPSRPRPVPHARDDSGDWSSRPTTPPAPPHRRTGSRPETRYGRLTPLRGLLAEYSRPSSRGSFEGFGRDSGGKGPDMDETGLPTPTASDREGERPRSAPDDGGRLRRTWSTPAFAELGDGLEGEEGGAFAFRRVEGS